MVMVVGVVVIVEGMVVGAGVVLMLVRMRV